MHIIWLIVVGFFQLQSTSCAEFQWLECYFIYQASAMCVPLCNCSHSELHCIRLHIFSNLLYFLSLCGVLILGARKLQSVILEVSSEITILSQQTHKMKRSTGLYLFFFKFSEQTLCPRVHLEYSSVYYQCNRRQTRAGYLYCRNSSF